jgi:tRNA dimethylallyltransferase
VPSREGSGRSIVAIFGPTGVGKTDVAVALGERLRARGEDPVAVSADAMQVYAGLEVLTAQPDAGQLARLEHRMVGILPVTEPFSAGRYAEVAHREIDDAVAAGRRVIVVGGTGLYLRAALAELELRPEVPAEVRARRTAQLAEIGSEALHGELLGASPQAAARIDPRDAVRIVRALELIDAGHRPPAERSHDSQLWTRDTRHPTLLAGLMMDRNVLRERIDARVDAMVAAGAADEVARAEAAGASHTARMAHGYRDLLTGDLDAMKTRSRQYSRRQLVWMRKLPGVLSLDVTGRAPEEVAEDIEAALDAREAA